MCTEQESRETESTKQQEDVSGSHRLLQQQSNQSSETIAPLLQQLSQLQLATSQLLHVSLLDVLYLLSYVLSVSINTLIRLL